MDSEDLPATAAARLAARLLQQHAYRVAVREFHSAVWAGIFRATAMSAISLGGAWWIIGYSQSDGAASWRVGAAAAGQILSCGAGAWAAWVNHQYVKHAGKNLRKQGDLLGLPHLKTTPGQRGEGGVRFKVLYANILMFVSIALLNAMVLLDAVDGLDGPG